METLFTNQPPGNFINRWMKQLLLSWISIFHLPLIIIGIANHSPPIILIITVSWLIFGIMTFIEAKVYITSISLLDNDFKISYFHYNKTEIAIIPKESISVELFGSVKGFSFSDRLKFFENDEIILTQYSISNYKLETFRIIQKELQEQLVK